MEKSIKSLQRKADRLRESLQEELGSSQMDLVDELVEVEIELEKRSNQ